jgi:hypothetical protein
MQIYQNNSTENVPIHQNNNIHKRNKVNEHIKLVNPENVNVFN